MNTDLLEFAVEAQRYAIPVRDVVEIVRAVAVTPLPAAPAIVEGVIDLRGQVVPVLDMRARFGLPPRPVDPSQHFIVARAGERLVVIRVDEAAKVSRVNLDDVEPIARVAPGTRHVAGVMKTADGMVLIHELAAFLTQAENEVLTETVQGEEGART